MEPAAEMQQLELKRVSGLNPEQAQQLIRMTTVPVVFEGMIEHWPAKVIDTHIPIVCGSAVGDSIGTHSRWPRSSGSSKQPCASIPERTRLLLKPILDTRHTRPANGHLTEVWSRRAQ